MEQEVARLRALRRLAQAAVPAEASEGLPIWMEQIGTGIVVAVPFLFLLSIISFLFDFVNPVNDAVPSGPMPTLESWLQRAPQIEGGRKTPTVKVDSYAIPLRPISSIVELWEAYFFATMQIVESVPSALFQRNYLVSLVLQAFAFPKVLSDWEKYESCAVGEVALGPNETALDPTARQVNAAIALPLLADEAFIYSPEKALREVVLQCDQLVYDYGLSLVARSAGESGDIIASAFLRVKRLPEGCHVEYDALDGDSLERSVVCTVDYDMVVSASGLEAVAYIEHIAVSEDFRGSGLAVRLLAFLEGKAKAWGFDLIALHVHRNNWSALRFYQRKGYETTSDWMGWGNTFFLLIKPL